MTTIKGRIIKGIGGFYYVDAAGVVFETRARGVFRVQGRKPLVGDIAQIELISEEEKTAVLIDIEERKNSLIRPEVANVDQALVIFACTHPEPNLFQLDKFLVNMEKQGVKSTIVFSKVDLDSSKNKNADLESLINIYENAGVDIIKYSALTSEGLEEIKELIYGKTTVLSGPSGVGKSTLINTLAPHYEGETGDISKKLGKGKNTTRQSEIIKVDDEGTYLIDTPGYSSVRLIVTDETELKYYIPEFQAPGFTQESKEKCRFADCMHINEIDCAVKKRVEENKTGHEPLAEQAIALERYNNYIRMIEEVKEGRNW